MIAGEPDRSLNAWHAELDGGLRDRVKVLGRVGRDELRVLMNESQIFYSPSGFESFGIAAAEALGCGCSVVAAESVSMASFEWFTGESSGQLAEMDSVDGHIAALRAELDAWAGGSRSPGDISSIWCERLHAEKVAARVVEMVRG
jgi:glycosyltransferase involved in cell wall biosynthesis